MTETPVEPTPEEEVPAEEEGPVIRPDMNDDPARMFDSTTFDSQQRALNELSEGNPDTVKAINEVRTQAGVEVTPAGEEELAPETPTEVSPPVEPSATTSTETPMAFDAQGNPVP